MGRTPTKSPRLPEKPRSGERVALLGVPIDLGASRRGTAMGPAALRAADLGGLLTELGFEVEDHGDISGHDLCPINESSPRNAKHYHDIQAWIRTLSARAHLLARSGAIPVFLGGDHSLSMGSVNGVSRHWREAGRELFVLWLDAHADYNTPVTTQTGNMHGMSAAFLCGEPGLDHLLGDEPRASIRRDQLDLVGARSIDKKERKLLRDRGIAVSDMLQIAESGVGPPIRQLIDKVRTRNGVLHVSFDVDFLDPTLAPGVGTTVPGGVDYREAHLVMELLRESGLVRSLDIVELNPLLDERGRTARIAIDLVGTLFGRQATDRLELTEPTTRP